MAIQFKRGSGRSSTTVLAAGQPYYDYTNNLLYIGASNGTTSIANTTAIKASMISPSTVTSFVSGGIYIMEFYYYSEDEDECRSYEYLKTSTICCNSEGEGNSPLMYKSGYFWYVHIYSSTNYFYLYSRKATEITYTYVSATLVSGTPTTYAIGTTTYFMQGISSVTVYRIA